MAAGIATLTELGICNPQSGVRNYQKLDEKTEKLTIGIGEAAMRAKISVAQNRVGSIFCTFFTDRKVSNYDDAKSCDPARYAQFFHGMLERGFYFAPSQFEVGFVSLAHTEADIEATIAAAGEVFRTL
jgi:glutamate-1-semialdehyde 2,1-aminomutase